jgi:formyltetrahydrofolate synthetase
MSFNWLPRVSFYAQSQQWAARQKALRQDADDVLSSLSDKLSDVAANQYSGTANLAAQAALDRINAAAKAKTAEAQAAAAADNPFDSSSSDDPNSVTLPDGTSVPVDTSTYLAGGSKIDLNAGTITLPDGTVIDAATGVKRVDLSV